MSRTVLEVGRNHAWPHVDRRASGMAGSDKGFRAPWALGRHSLGGKAAPKPNNGKCRVCVD